MRISTLLKSGLLRGVAFASICAMGLSASAAAIYVLDNGLVYKVDKGKAQVSGTKYTTGSKKGQPIVCENGTAPDGYKGEFVVPTSITYNGTTYPVSSIANGFKASEVTKVTVPTGVAVARGSFQDCALLEEVVLPGDIDLIDGNTFQNCVKLATFTIPASVTNVMSAAFAGCEGLETFIFEASETPITFKRDVFSNVSPAIKHLTIARPIADSELDMKAFRGAAKLESVVIDGHFTTIASNFFENDSALVSVEFKNQPTSIDYSAFAGTAIVEIAFPETITDIPASLMANCKGLKKVTLGSAVTNISAMAFYNSTLEEINFPATLKTIGNMAFSGTNLKGDVVIPEAVTSIGDQAFANNAAVTSFTIPASVKSIGTGAFMGCTGVTKFVVAEGNEAYVASADGTYITTKDGETLVAYAPAAAATEFTGNFKTVAPYAFYGAKNLTSVVLPECSNWGDYSLRGTGIKALTISGTVGRYVAADCPALEEITIGCKEVPTGICANNANLVKVTLNPMVTIVRQDAFAGCVKVEDLNLGSVLVILETDCFKGAGIKHLTVASTYPASMADGVFTAESGITVTVPADLVGAYKAATGWSLLNIEGDANLAAGGTKMGMPAGLYYAGDDNDLHCCYADGQSDVYPINMQHTFQLVEFGNRIYGASAGRKFWYSDSAATEGDGKLFYISQVDGNLFQAVVLDNTGNNAYKDPTGLYIYDSTLYVNDRNVCVRKISADALALPQSYPSWMENNWMPFYGPTWTYGCVKNGFAITKDVDADGNAEPRYWVGMKFNGCGLFSFKQGNIGTSSSEVGSPNGAVEYLTNIGLIATSFNIDTKYGYIYMYIEYAGTESAQIKGGLYRFPIENLEQTPTPTAADFMSALGAELIDGSPVLYEGNATNEHVGISQLAIDADGEYMYWCYRAPTPEEAAAQEAQTFAEQQKGAYWWATPYDESNPLHHSGIKRIKLGVETPTVEMVVPGVTGYGIVPVNYEGSTKPLEGVAPVLEQDVKAIEVVDGAIVALEDVHVVVYDAAGTMVAVADLAAGQTLATTDLAAGLYIATAGKQAVKFVK